MRARFPRVVLVVAFGVLGLVLSMAYNTELYRFPVIVPPSRLLQGAAVMLVFIGIAQILIFRMIHKFDWLEVLRTRE